MSSRVVESFRAAAGQVLRFGYVAVAGAFLADPAGASSLPVASYDMNNGDGQASGGSFNYWDRFYTGTGATTTDDAPLNGGVGDLTDGIVPVQRRTAESGRAVRHLARVDDRADPRARRQQPGGWRRAAAPLPRERQRVVVHSARSVYRRLGHDEGRAVNRQPGVD